MDLHSAVNAALMFPAFATRLARSKSRCGDERFSGLAKARRVRLFKSRPLCRSLKPSFGTTIRSANPPARRYLRRGCLPFCLSRSSRKRAWFPSSRPACFSSLSLCRLLSRAAAVPQLGCSCRWCNHDIHGSLCFDGGRVLISINTPGRYLCVVRGFRLAVKGRGQRRPYIAPKECGSF